MDIPEHMMAERRAMTAERPATRKAVVSYSVDASVAEKCRALFEGIRECAAELIRLDIDPGEVERELEQVANDVQAGEVV